MVILSSQANDKVDQTNAYTNQALKLKDLNMKEQYPEFMGPKPMKMVIELRASSWHLLGRCSCSVYHLLPQNLKG